MAKRYEISPKFEKLADGQMPPAGSTYVEVLSESEFVQLGTEIDATVRDELNALLQAESCYVNFYPDYLIGSIAVPNKNDLMGERDLFSFYWQNDRLIFIDEGTVAERTMQRVANTEMASSMTSATCLYLFLRELISVDHTWLGDLEDKMEDAEEAMLDSGSEEQFQEVNSYRRITIRMTNYYRQLGEMALALAGNDYGLMDPADASQFNTIVAYADRLVARSETIREYSLQLRELHQTQLDMAQNNTMQLLTIVTVILAPLTLIAGWFGMNFTNIPGVGEPWGFPVICVVGAVLTLILILWFHKKRWI